MLKQDNIRNFCIIAHIDHGKSTLADRFLEITKTVEKRVMQEQFLDQMELERERGITIKLQPVRMEYEIQGEGYILNLVDTPGHVDFSYEVSRSLAAVEGAILLVDVTQGIQAQTLANLHLAQRQGLKLIGAVNKIDLSFSESHLIGVIKQLAELLGQEPEQIAAVSGKTGEGAQALLHSVVERFAAPVGNQDKPLKALVFDSFYDAYKGVVAFVRVIDGQLSQGEALYLMATQTKVEALETGIFRPKLTPKTNLGVGEIGYVATGIKNPSLVRVGDTLTKLQSLAVDFEALPGYQEPQPVVFVSFYPQDADELKSLEDALAKLKLSDASLSFSRERQDVLGQGFRLGFLGTLHLEIIKERLKREYSLEPIVTIPSVKYNLVLTDGSQRELFSAEDLPSLDKISEIQEPWVKGEIVVPHKYLGGVLSLIQAKRGFSTNLENIFGETVLLHFELPLNEIILDFYDKLKSVSQGYASLSYELVDYRKGELVKLDILVASERIGAFARIVSKDRAEYVGRRVIEKLKDILDRELFPVALQAAIGTQIIARETLPALKKNLGDFGKNGGDRTRKMKLWKKQKEGKKRLTQLGRVNVKAEVFFEVFKVSKD